MVVHASRISSGLSMCRQTSGRSGRWRRCWSVALRTTSHPSRSPARDGVVDCRGGAPSPAGLSRSSPAVPTVRAPPVGHHRGARRACRRPAFGPPRRRIRRSAAPDRAAGHATARTTSRAPAPARPPPVTGRRAPTRGAVTPRSSSRRRASGTPGCRGTSSTTGLVLPAATAASTRPTSSARPDSSVGAKTTTTEWTPASSTSWVSACWKSAVVGPRTEVAGCAHDLEPCRDGGVGGEQPQRVGVADDRDPRPRGQRLAGQQLRHVEQLGECVDPDHPGLPNSALERGVRRVGAAARRARAARPAWCRRSSPPPSASATAHPASEAGELARVAQRLEVEQDDLGGRIVLPVLEQVVARHVGPVARGDERRQANPARSPRARAARCRGRRTGEKKPDPAGAGRPVAASGRSAGRPDRC